MIKKNHKVLIIGLGYVGLPLCIALKKKNYSVSGFDINKKLISSLTNSIDEKKILEKKDFKYLKLIEFSSKIENFEKNNIYIITVPTPVYKNYKPNFSYVINSLKHIAKVLKKNDTIILESTVYPGFSEDHIYPFFKKNFNFEVNKDYFYGYSPERINPSDKIRNISNINKVISSENKNTLLLMEKIYKSIVTKAKLHKTVSIKVAEASKVIENTQRDVNISLINEFSLIFNKLDIDTKEVLAAANTKWNFHNYSPGLVGGHCIGVDPYYLTYKSKKVGYDPKVILSGRNVNDKLPNTIVKIIDKLIKQKSISVNNILFLGTTFKENCSDLRNSGSVKLLKILNSKFKKTSIDVVDSYVKNNPFLLKSFNIIDFPKNLKNYQLIIIAVPHDDIKMFVKKNIKFKFKEKKLIIDLKAILPKDLSHFRL